MPKIYEYFGLFFLIYVNEHEPIHIHVQNSDKRESVIEIIRNSSGKVSEVRKRKSSTGKELPMSELSVAMKFVNVKAEEIVEAWVLIKKGKFNKKPIIITRKIV